MAGYSVCARVYSSTHNKRQQEAGLRCSRRARQAETSFALIFVAFFMAVYRRVTVEVVLKASNLSANLFGTFVHLLYAVWALSLPSSILKAYTWKSAQVTACKSWLLLTRKEPRNDWIFWRGGLQCSLTHGHYIWRSSTGSCIWLIGVTLKRPMQSVFCFQDCFTQCTRPKIFRLSFTIT